MQYDVSRNLLDWLTYPKSITEKLLLLDPKAIIHVVNHHLESADDWDKFCLRFDDDIILHREILSKSDSVLYWYARTCVPSTTYYNHKDFFDSLTDTPLRKLLFNNPRVNRNYFNFYSINAHCIEYKWIAAYLSPNVSNIWCRMSLYTIQHDKFYLFEALLPELYTLIEKKPTI